MNRTGARSVDRSTDRSFSSEGREVAIEVAHLEMVSDDRFRGRPGHGNHMGNVFGGRFLAQALASACRTVRPIPCSSLHAYFLAPGSIDGPIDYGVTRLRDSRRFSNRQVLATQDGKPVFTLTAAFHEPELGFSHQIASMPDVPDPEQVIPLDSFLRDEGARLDLSRIAAFNAWTPVELRPLDPESFFTRRTTERRAFWIRMPSAAGMDAPHLQQCLLAYLSDCWLAGALAAPHRNPDDGSGIMLCSLDHGLWFHRQTKVEDWLLFDVFSPSAGDGIGLAEGRIFDRGGRLVASCVQETLLRRLPV